MNEMSKQFSPEPSRESADPYANWTDDQRMSEYAYTGNSEYLTPELARRMKVGYEAMLEVPNATEEDLEVARQWSAESEEETNKMMQEFYGKYGLDDASLKELREREDENVTYLDRLFDVASRPIDTENRDEQDDVREIVEYAKGLLKEYAVSTEEGVLDLVGMIRSREIAGVRDVQVVEEVFNDILREFVALSNTPAPLDEESARSEQVRGDQLAEALNQFAYISEQTLQADSVHKDANYLADRYFYNFCLKQKFTEPTTLDNDELWLANEMVGLERLADFDRDNMIPFEIEEGRLALFGHDSAVLYVADKEYSAEQKQTFNDLKSQISYRVAGQYFARRVVADLPYDLEWESGNFYDATAQLGRDENVELFSDKELLRDYLYLQRADMRETVERDFGVELKSLSVKEQAFFLRYLQKTSMEHVQLMQRFTSLYGVDGMRTFLSLERGDETLGDHIVTFGQHDEVAGTVFKYYGELLDQADKIEDEGVRERVLARAQKDLETAVRAHDPVSIAERLHTYVAEAKVEVALIQEGIKKPLSATTTNELASDLPERMQTISARNYSKESPEFQELMREGMAAKFNEPNRRWYVDQTDSGEIIFFDSFTDVPDEETGEVQHKTFEAVNLGDDKYGGAGAARLKQTLDAELADGLPIQAFSDPENPVSQLYIEHGFVAVGTVSPAGKFSFELWRNGESSELLHTKQLSTPELIAQIENSEETKNFTIRAVENGDRFPELSDGQCLTRYFKHNGQQYAVFETVPAELQNGFVLPPEEQVLAA